MELRDWEPKNLTAECLAPTWLKNLHVHNILELGLSKNRYKEVFNHYLGRCGYQKKRLTKQAKTFSNTEATDVDHEDIGYDEIEDVSFDEFLELERGLHSKRLERMDNYKYYKYRFKRDFSFGNTQLFPLMLHERGRRLLQRIDWELREVQSDELIRERLSHDYIETMDIDTLLLDQMRRLTDALGLKSSVDPQEMTADRFERPEVTQVAHDLGSLLTLPDVSKSVTRVSHVIKYWNGNGIEPVKSKGGKCVKKVRVKGKRLKVYAIQGPNEFW